MPVAGIAGRATITGPAPADLIDTGRYPLDDTAERARLIERCRSDVARDGNVLLPGFLRPAAVARMVAEVAASRPRAWRRDVMAGVYPGAKPSPDLPATHPVNRRHPSKMSGLAADVIDTNGAIARLYCWEGMPRLVADIMNIPALHRVADGMLCCNVTILGPGDQHAWHFDSNDFVVSLLLQRVERGGRFEFAPYVRGPEQENYEQIERILDGTPGTTQIIDLQPGTLAIFCGKYSVHRVTEVLGQGERFIALFSYDRKPDMQFSEASRLSTFGRPQPFEAAA